MTDSVPILTDVKDSSLAFMSAALALYAIGSVCSTRRFPSLVLEPLLKPRTKVPLEPLWVTL